MSKPRSTSPVYEYTAAMDRRKEGGETGDHRLFAFLTTESNDVVRPIHAKAMPVLLTTEE